MKTFPRIRRPTPDPFEFVRANRNENLYSLDKLNPDALYPDPVPLVNLLANSLGVHARNIILGTGAESLIRDFFLVCHLNDIQEIFIPAPTYFMYQYYANLFNIKIRNYDPLTLLYEGLSIVEQHDIMVERKSRVAYIFIVPNSPLGISGDEFRAFVNRIELIAEDYPVLLDQVYFGFDPGESFFYLKSDYAINVFSFSKTYGLAGLRVGFALCGNKMAAMMDSVRLAIELPRYAIEMAEDILSNHSFNVAKKFNLDIIRLKEETVDALHRKGIRVLKNHTNSITIQMNNQMEADDLLSRFERKKILVGTSQYNGSVILTFASTNRTYVHKILDAI